MLHDHIKDDIKAAADIVEVVSGYVKLKRSGSNWQGLCPFHNEKSPSFNVNPSLGIFKCFGCGESGDVFSFLMKIDGLSFPEAMKVLAERYHITIPEKSEVLDEAKSREALLTEGAYMALAFAGRYYHTQLADTEEAEPARAYLRKRGFTGETVRKYGIGYAPDRMDALIRAAEEASIVAEYLIEAGLVKQDENGTRLWDTFRGRLLFPIFNPAGKVTGFGGRILTESKKAPKYINSPQSRVYNKSEALYGIHAAKGEIRKTKEAILVEGYTDVLQLHQAGIRNVVATSGTALTAEQLRLLHRYGETLLMIFDADQAGQNAMDRGLDLALAEGLAVRVLHLPDGEDPDSFVKQFGGEAFRNVVKKDAVDFMRFLIAKSRQGGEWNDPQTRRSVITRILQSISKMPDAITRETYVQQLSEWSKVGDIALKKELSQLMRAEAGRPAPRAASAPSPRPAASERTDDVVTHASRTSRPAPGYEQALNRHMIAHGYPMVEFIGGHINAEHFEDEGMKALFEDIVARYEAHEPISTDVYVNHPRFSGVVGDLFVERHTPSKRLSRDGDLHKTVKGELKSIRLGFLDRLKARFEAEYNANGSASERAAMAARLTDVTRERSRLASTPIDRLYP
jgi:DNA primase